LVVAVTAETSLIPEVAATVIDLAAVVLIENLTVVEDVAKPDVGTAILYGSALVPVPVRATVLVISKLFVATG
jgi:hypothetical protein